MSEEHPPYLCLFPMQQAPVLAGSGSLPPCQVSLVEVEHTGRAATAAALGGQRLHRPKLQPGLLFVTFLPLAHHQWGLIRYSSQSRPRPCSLASLEEGTHVVTLWAPLFHWFSLRPAGAKLRVSARMNQCWGLLSAGRESDRHNNPNRQPRFLDLFPCSECWIKITKKISQHCSSAICQHKRKSKKKKKNT